MSKYHFICGPTCGCGKSTEGVVTQQGYGAPPLNCTHCGKPFVGSAAVVPPRGEAETPTGLPHSSSPLFMQSDEELRATLARTESIAETIRQILGERGIKYVPEEKMFRAFVFPKDKEPNAD